MKNFVICCVVGLVAALAGTATAQMDNSIHQPGTLLDNPIKSSFSLLDPSRLKISHAYSFSYLSGGTTSGSVGMYRSIIQYQLARPLTLRVGLAYAHNPLTAFGGESGGLVREGLYPSFQLEYRPSKHFYFGIGYERVPGSLYYSPYFERSGRSGWGSPVDWWRTR
ncbi:hypothetical protein ACFLQW_04025 [Candidatus Zixiibacteriota bacterium]